MNLTTSNFPSARNSSVPALDVEVAFTSLPTEGPIWRRITSDVRDFSTVRGRPREFDRFSAGRLNVTLDNNSRDYDPEWTSGPLYGNILPEKRVRILASYNSTQYVIFDGFVDGWPQEWLDFGKDAKVQLSATDGFKVLAQAELPSSMYEMVVATDKPTHWWKLDETSGTTAIDSGYGTRTSGTYVGGPTLNSAGLVAYDGSRTSVNFDGNNDAVTFASNSEVFSSSVYTIEAWCSSSSALSQTIFGAGGVEGGVADSVNTRAAVAITSTGNFFRFQILDATTTTITGTSVVNDGAAHWVAVRRDDPSIDLLVDGASEATGSRTATLPAGSRPPQISGRPEPVVMFVGKIGHVLVWDGRVLTAAQLTDHYNAGKNGLTGESTGTRVRRVLDYAGWPGFALSTSADRDLDTGSSTVGAVDLSGSTALDYLQTLHDTEQGQMYMGLDSALSSDSVFKFVWRQRHALITASRSNTSQATFSDTGSLRYADLELSYDETKVYNESRVTRSGGAEQTATDATSQTKYFKRSYERSGLLYSSDNDSFDHATWAINRYKNPSTRVEAVIIKPLDSPANLWPQVLSREIGDRITVTRSSISKEVIIEGIEHDYDGEDWTTTFRCSPADLGPYWLLDDSTFSVLDTTTIPAF